MASTEIRFSSMSKLSLFSVILILNFCNCYCSDGDYISAVAGLQILLNTESQLLNDLQIYVNEVSEHIEALKSEIENIRTEHLLASHDLETYLSNPLNAYRLIKRLQNDWTTFEGSVQDSLSAKNFLDAMNVHRQSLNFPDENDVNNAAMALVRLQDTYQLDVAQLASGFFNGIKIGSSMSWQDCFLLGHQLYAIRDFNHTIPWLKQSMKLLAAEDYNENPTSLDFMATVAAYHQEMGDFGTALELIQHILDVDPTRQALEDIRAYLEEMILNGIQKGQMHESNLRYNYHETNEYKLYERVCRGEVSATPTQERRLRCKYYSNNISYRILHPFKMEELSLDPYIVQFHDMIRTEQMEILKQFAAPKMERSRVCSLNSTNEVVAKYRTSKTAWFEYDTHPYMQEMLQNVADFSSLDMSNAEQLQVANYGIGGHYEPHWDFFTDLTNYDIQEGNRIATAIFYISDVEEGGGTAFPFLPLLVKPTRGSVLFWYNLHASEEPDYRTKHGACPVLSGSKWIANIWIRVRGQEFTHPCGLQPDHEVSTRFSDFD